MDDGVWALQTTVAKNMGENNNGINSHKPRYLISTQLQLHWLTVNWKYSIYLVLAGSPFFSEGYPGKLLSVNFGVLNERIYTL